MDRIRANHLDGALRVGGVVKVGVVERQLVERRIEIVQTARALLDDWGMRVRRWGGEG